MHRLFVALRPPPPIRDLLNAVMDGVVDARWQDDEQLHLTLRYIGEVDRRHAEDIAATLGAIRAPSPEVRLAAVGSFERRGRATSLWAGVEPAEPLAALHRKVDQALVRTGLPPEGRAFRPHVTVARLSRTAGGSADVARWLAAHSGFASATFRMDHLILYESHIGQQGAHYSAIARWPLAQAC